MTELTQIIQDIGDEALAKVMGTDIETFRELSKHLGTRLTAQSLVERGQAADLKEALHQIKEYGL